MYARPLKTGRAHGRMRARERGMSPRAGREWRDAVARAQQLPSGNGLSASSRSTVGPFSIWPA